MEEEALGRRTLTSVGSETSKRRRPVLKIETDRKLEDETDDECSNKTMALAYMQRHRERRVRKGDKLLRNCVTVFMVSLLGVLVCKQYSNAYYLAWCSTYCSFFLILPSVLPCDNGKIKILLFASGWNMTCGFVFATRYAKLKYHQYITKECEHQLHIDPTLCYFNPFFLVSSAILAAYACFSIYSAFDLSPCQGLHRFWRTCGIYFIFVGLFNAINWCVSYGTGQYDLPHYHNAGRWNLALTTLQFIIGILCLCNRFKTFMWRFAASNAAIKLRATPTNFFSLQPDTHFFHNVPSS